MSEANKASKHIAEMRTNLKLMDKSKEVSGASIRAAREELTLYLEDNFLKYPPSMKLIGLKPGMSLVERKQHLRVDKFSGELTSEEIELQAKFTELADENRKANWMWRIGAQCVEMDELGWFPYFITLTLDPNKVDDTEAFWKVPIKGKTVLQWYLRKLCNVVTKEMGHIPAHKSGVPQTEYVKHVCSIEHGATRLHHHLHGIIWMRCVPANWRTCPNRGRPPEQRNADRCLPMESLWPWSLPGLSPCKFFRHTGDIWSRHGFLMHTVKGKPFKIRPAMSAGVYMSKYLGKDDKEWHHKVKATQNLGLMKLRQRLWEMRRDGLLPLTWRPRKYNTNISIKTIHSIPSGLLRSAATQIHFSKTWDAKALDIQNALKPNSEPFKQMLESAQNGARASRMSLPQLYEWVSEHLPVPEGYCEKRLLRRHNAISNLYPASNYQSIEPIPGLDHGLT